MRYVITGDMGIHDLGIPVDDFKMFYHDIIRRARREVRIRYQDGIDDYPAVRVSFYKEEGKTLHLIAVVIVSLDCIIYKKFRTDSNRYYRISVYHRKNQTMREGVSFVS